LQGLVSSNVTLNNNTLRGWEVFPLQLDDPSSLAFAGGEHGAQLLAAVRRRLLAPHVLPTRRGNAVDAPSFFRCLRWQAPRAAKILPSKFFLFTVLYVPHPSTCSCFGCLFRNPACLRACRYGLSRQSTTSAPNLSISLQGHLHGGCLHPPRRQRPPG
jgi:hypothetical protein